MLILSISMNVKILIFLIGFPKALGCCSMLQYIQQAEKNILCIFPFWVPDYTFQNFWQQNNFRCLKYWTFIFHYFFSENYAEYKNKIYTFSLHNWNLLFIVWRTQLFGQGFYIIYIFIYSRRSTNILIFWGLSKAIVSVKIHFF